MHGTHVIYDEIIGTCVPCISGPPLAESISPYRLQKHRLRTANKKYHQKNVYFAFLEGANCF